MNRLNHSLRFLEVSLALHGLHIFEFGIAIYEEVHNCYICRIWGYHYVVECYFPEGGHNHHTTHHKKESEHQH